MLNQIKIDGQVFDVDDFEGRELLEAEKVFGVNLLAGIDEPSMSVVYALVWLVKRRANPGFTPDQAMRINLGDLSKMMGQDAEEDENPPSKPAGKRGSKSPA